MRVEYALTDTGAGHYAVQIALNAGAHVIGVSSAGSRDFVLGLGAHEHIDYENKQFESLVKDADVVLDTVSAKTVERSLAEATE